MEEGLNSHLVAAYVALQEGDIMGGEERVSAAMKAVLVKCVSQTCQAF